MTIFVVLNSKYNHNQQIFLIQVIFINSFITHIMKKLLSLLLVAMMLPMAMSAQLLPNGDARMHRAPYALKGFDQKRNLPARVNLAENQKIMGHYDTDDVITGGYLGLTNLPGVIPIATIITPDELALFQGGKIVKFRVGLASGTPVTRVFVTPVDAGGNLSLTTEWSCNVSAEGWNEITLPTPYEINLESNYGLMIGFDYRQTSSNYPISAVEVGEIYPSYCLINGQWQNVGLDSYGNLSVQCIVESDNFADYMVTVGGLAVKNYIKLGDDIQFGFSTKNLGVAQDAIAAGTCAFNVLIDGEVVGTFTNPEPIDKDFIQIYESVNSADLTPGKHTLTVQVSTLNGEPVEVPMSVSRDFIIYVNGFPRQMHVVEQFTSTYCTYCPLGNSMLTILTNMRDDVAWVGIHGNMNGTDPMRTLQCDSIMAYQGSDTYPSGSFDRSTGFASDDAIVTGIGYYEEYHQLAAEEVSSFFDYLGEAPSFATININSTIDASTREAVITINGDLTPDFDDMMGADSKLTVYITEDHVVARQLNLGTWVQQYVHNGVMRRALNSVFGSNLNRNGDTYENVFTYTIPSAWNIDNLNVVAFISRPLSNGATGVYTDLYINQANKRKLGEFDEPVVSIRGDLDQDGLVAIRDLTLLIDYLLSNDSTGLDLNAADCNESGSIEINDVTSLIDYLLKGTW